MTLGMCGSPTERCKFLESDLSSREAVNPGNPSNLDLGITGHVDRWPLRPSLFVGVEAKVDETFGSTVRSRYSSAMKTREAGKNTNAPEEGERPVVEVLFGQGFAGLFPVRRYSLSTLDGNCRHGCRSWQGLRVLYPGFQNFNVR